MKAPFLVFVPTAVVIAEVNGNVNRTKMLNVKVKRCRVGKITLPLFNA